MDEKIQLKSLREKVGKCHDINKSDFISDGYRKVKALQDDISPCLDQDCDDADGFIKVAAEITLRFQQLLMCYQWHLKQSESPSQPAPPEEISKYLLEGEGCRFLRSLIRKTGGSTCILQELFKKDQQWQSDLENSPGMYCVPLVEFMINSHMTEDFTDTLIDRNYPQSLNHVIDYVLFACGFREGSLASTIRNQQQNCHWNDPNRVIEIIPTRWLDEKLSKLIRPLVDSAASIADKPIGNPWNYSSPLIKAAAFLYLPKLTRILMERFDVTDLGEEGLNIIELSIHALCLYQCDYQSFNEITNLIVDTQTIKIQNKYFVRDLADFQAKHIEMLHCTPHASVSMETFQAKSRILLDMLGEVTVLYQVDKNLVHLLVFRTIQLFPTFYAAGLLDEYGSVLSTMFDSADFDVNKIYPDDRCRNSSVFSLLVEMEIRHGNFPYQALVEHPSFRPSPDCLHYIIRRIGEGIKHVLTQKWQALVRFLNILLTHPQTDVSWKDDSHHTSTDLCISQENDFTRIVLVFMLRILNEHESAKEKEIYKALCCLAKMPIAECEQTEAYSEIGERFFQMKFSAMYKKTVGALTEGNFDINYQGPSKSTIVHVAASYGNVFLTKHLIRHKDFNPNLQDTDGNSAMFLIIRNFERPEDIGYVHEIVKSKLKLEVKNNARQTLYDVCDDIKDLSSRKTVEKLVGKCPAIAQAADVDATRVPAEIASHVVDLQLASVHASHLAVRSTTKIAMETVTQNHAKEGLGVYKLKKRKKGKACIISVHEFHVQWLAGLDGYIYDRENLQSLWQQTGFDVYIPKTVHPFNNSQLTKVELEMAVQKFAESLDDEDDCAVLCILSHGGNGFVYGKDGKKAFLDQLLKHFNNENCPKMMDKPKVVIIQACNGNMTDTGQVVAANAGQIVTPAASLEILPTISDTIVIYPSQPGYISYVYTTPGEGSVLIKELTAIFGRYAATDDIHKLLTRLNKAVSDETFGDGSNTKKQMPRFTSDLRRLLYFFPLGDETAMDA